MIFNSKLAILKSLEIWNYVSLTPPDFEILIWIIIIYYLNLFVTHICHQYLNKIYFRKS
jgi:hypothetical protein